MAAPEVNHRNHGKFRTLGMPSFFEGGSDSDGEGDSEGTKDTLAASEITLHPSCSGFGVNLEQAGLEIEADDKVERFSAFPKKEGPLAYFPPLVEGEEGRGASLTPSVSNQDEEMDSGDEVGQYGSWFRRALTTRQQTAEHEEEVDDVEPSVTASKYDSECDVVLPPLDTLKELDRFQSFRAGFGPGNTLAIRSESQPGHFTGCRFLSVGNSGAPKEFLRERVRRTLEICHEFSSPVEDGEEQGVPRQPCPNRRVVSCGRGLLDKVAAAITRVNFELREVYANGLSEEECDKLEHGMETWLLVSTLFGKVSDVAETDPEIHLMERRAKIGSWIQKCTAKSVEDGLRSIFQIDMDEEEPIENKEEADYFAALGLLLSGGHWTKAACLAASKGDAKLAALLDTAGPSQADQVKDYLALIDKTGHSEDYLSPERRAIYEVLAGNLEWLETGVYLDWRRMLGCYMWYVCPEKAPIHEVLATYDKERATYEGQTDVVNRPWPHYYDRGEQGDSFDTQYKLLHLYSTLEKDSSLEEGQLGELLDTTGYSENPMDVLNSWMLLGVLLSSGAIVDEDLKSCDQILSLHTSMISVCESLGIPEWAVFVAVHMPIADQERTKIIKEILKRAAPLLEGSTSGPVFMSEELGVPVQWIHEALALWYYYKGDRRNQFIQLLKAEHYVRAHDVFCRHVGLIAFETQDNQLGDFVQSMKRAPVEIPMWSHGGAIYLQFERIMGEYGQSPREAIEEHIVEFKASVREAADHWAACTPTMESRIQMHCFFQSMVEKLVKETRRFDTLELPSSQVLF
ncbi:hypothetical protein BSKO_09197 [Bryopsis sp. KO-2023]|nr:hypothetical protein BSKO_09197 [Bryopsis sp. KO-2023]